MQTKKLFKKMQQKHIKSPKNKQKLFKHLHSINPLFIQLIYPFRCLNPAIL